MREVTASGQFSSAIKHGDILRVRELLDDGADADARNPHGWTPLMHAAETGHTGIIELLLSRGADVNATNEFGCSALAYAALEGRVGAIRMLLSAGASVGVSPYGVSLLQFAASGGGRFQTQQHFDILREAGAS
ncbi:MAG TPA: ankyrin repeat domain-containing protein [Thermoanaerobaculia bacterium]|jgi:ankyrin repeat protein|nr:ankyrin repeat domain-containing protein [Thermoanaerobaculia bacterium]